MNVLLGISVLLLVSTWWIQGFNAMAVAATVATVLFCGRKVGYFCKLKTVVTLEVIGFFIATVWQLVVTDFLIFRSLSLIVLRLLFIGIVLYDTEIYVYVTEERRKEEE